MDRVQRGTRRMFRLQVMIKQAEFIMGQLGKAPFTGFSVFPPPLENFYGEGRYRDGEKPSLLVDLFETYLLSQT